MRAVKIFFLIYLIKSQKIYHSIEDAHTCIRMFVRIFRRISRKFVYSLQNRYVSAKLFIEYVTILYADLYIRIHNLLNDEFFRFH